ncbi:hypothetical protein EJB05_23618, partial [Eragrostis curvula]
MPPPRSIAAGAWDMSYHDSILAGAAHFKQESPELVDAAALLQYSNRLAELPQLESPPPPNHDSHRGGTADGEGAYDLDARQYAAVSTTDWRALDRFVASQLIPDEKHADRGLAQEFDKPAGVNAGDSGDETDIVALLLLDGVLEKDAGLLGSVASTSACLPKNDTIYDF